MKNRLFRIKNIKWDCDDPSKCYANDGTKLSDLTDFIFETEIYDDLPIDTQLIDILSDEFGWCHHGFNFEEITMEDILNDIWESPNGDIELFEYAHNYMSPDYSGDQEEDDDYYEDCNNFDDVSVEGDRIFVKYNNEEEVYFE